jgi:hypothetical protein
MRQELSERSIRALARGIWTDENLLRGALVALQKAPWTPAVIPLMLTAAPSIGLGVAAA